MEAAALALITALGHVIGTDQHLHLGYRQHLIPIFHSKVDSQRRALYFYRHSIMLNLLLNLPLQLPECEVTAMHSESLFVQAYSRDVLEEVCTATIAVQAYFLFMG